MYISSLLYLGMRYEFFYVASFNKRINFLTYYKALSFYHCDSCLFLLYKREILQNIYILICSNKYLI